MPKHLILPALIFLLTVAVSRGLISEALKRDSLYPSDILGMEGKILSPEDVKEILRKYPEAEVGVHTGMVSETASGARKANEWLIPLTTYTIGNVRFSVSSAGGVINMTSVPQPMASSLTLIVAAVNSLVALIYLILIMKNRQEK